MILVNTIPQLAPSTHVVTPQDTKQIVEEPVGVLTRSQRAALGLNLLECTPSTSEVQTGPIHKKGKEIQQDSMISDIDGAFLEAIADLQQVTLPMLESAPKGKLSAEFLLKNTFQQVSLYDMLRLDAEFRGDTLSIMQSLYPGASTSGGHLPVQPSETYMISYPTAPLTDYWSPRLTMTILRKQCLGVIVDGGSGINLMPEFTMIALGLQPTRPAPFTVTLADQRTKIGLLGTPFAKFADSVMKTVINSILHDPLKVKLSEEISTSGDAVLSWVKTPNVEEDVTALAILYNKLLKVVHFLQLYVSCNHDSWTKELGRFIWPRMADAIISGYLSKAVPNEVSEAAKFQESATLTLQFEKSLSKLHFINDPSPLGDKLGKFAADVEVHFVSKKKSRIIARVRRLLVRFDFSTLYKDLKGASSSGEQNKTELFFQLEHCVISHAAKQLVDIVHGVLADACVVATKMSLELYRTSRDAFLLYAAIVPVKLAKELKELSLEAIVHHNDCLYLGHESLALNYQVQGSYILWKFPRCICPYMKFCEA
ncbi:hypothetical protein L7F22_015166 [Adiantum nelumboides]|nr:hypothetical protein [Adiantum nelumboides]